MTNLKQSPANRAFTDKEIIDCKEWKAMDRILPYLEDYTIEDYAEIFENYEIKT